MAKSKKPTKKQLDKIWKRATFIKNNIQALGQGHYVQIHDEGDEAPYIEVRRKQTSKKIMFILAFDNHGNIDNILVGKHSGCLWIKTKMPGK